MKIGKQWYFDILLNYRGHGKRYGIIKFGNGYTFRAGRFAAHVWRIKR